MGGFFIFYHRRAAVSTAGIGGEKTSEADDIIHIKSGAGAAVSVNKEGQLYCGRGKTGASGARINRIMPPGPPAAKAGISGREYSARRGKAGASARES